MEKTPPDGSSEHPKLTCENGCAGTDVRLRYEFCPYCGYSYTEDVIPIGFDVMVWAEILSALDAANARMKTEDPLPVNSLLDVTNARKKILNTIERELT